MMDQFMEELQNCDAILFTKFDSLIDLIQQRETFTADSSDKVVAQLVMTFSKDMGVSSISK